MEKNTKKAWKEDFIRVKDIVTLRDVAKSNTELGKCTWLIIEDEQLLHDLAKEVHPQFHNEESLSIPKMYKKMQEGKSFCFWYKENCLYYEE